MNAIGYVRVSTAEQAVSGLGLADQRQRIEAYCVMRGLTLVRIIDEHNGRKDGKPSAKRQRNGCSGGKPLAKRLGGAKLLEALRRKQASAVVTLKLDRCFRNAADCLATVEAWQRKGVVWHVIDLGGNAIDTSSANGKFMLTVLAGAAEMERNLTRERTRAALAVKRGRGERISRHPPFGYRFADGKLKLEPSEQRAVKAVLRLRKRGLSLRQISSRLAERGIFGRTGQPLSAKTIAEIVKRAV